MLAVASPPPGVAADLGAPAPCCSARAQAHSRAGLPALAESGRARRAEERALLEKGDAYWPEEVRRRASAGVLVAHAPSQLERAVAWRTEHGKQRAVVRHLRCCADSVASGMCCSSDVLRPCSSKPPLRWRSCSGENHARPRRLLHCARRQSSEDLGSAAALGERVRILRERAQLWCVRSGGRSSDGDRGVCGLSPVVALSPATLGVALPERAAGALARAASACVCAVRPPLGAQAAMQPTSPRTVKVVRAARVQNASRLRAGRESRPARVCTQTWPFFSRRRPR